MLILTFKPITAQLAVQLMDVKAKVAPLSRVCTGYQVRILSISNTPSEGIGYALF